MSKSSSDDRINRLHNLTETLDDDNSKRDKASMMSRLSQEFVRQMGMAEKCIKDNDLGAAEAHRLIADGSLATFEAIKE